MNSESEKMPEVIQEELLDEKVMEYARFLLEYNQKVNLVSRNMTLDGLKQLIGESLLLREYVTEGIGSVVDVGSGNGVLGIPVALLDPRVKVALVEPRQKKVAFLQEMKSRLGITNLDVFGISFEEYMKKFCKTPVSLIARGFPDFSVFCKYLEKGLLTEVVLVTSVNKIKKNQLHLESLNQKTYNVPLRDYLKILKILPMEKTARGKRKKM